MTPLERLFSSVNSGIDVARLWEGGYKIPWNNPAFSERMLEEHLNQEHDLASRNAGQIEQQVQWIHDHLLGGGVSCILDLCCGPGFYTSLLGKMGHSCLGIDFSPASIQYAAREFGSHARFIESDILTADMGSGFDLCLLLYGEMNVFSPGECRTILRKIWGAISPGGMLLLEPQSVDAVKSVGQAPRSWNSSGTGLTGIFSEIDHLCIIDNQWLSEETIALQRFHIVDRNGDYCEYRSTTKAWSDKELTGMLASCGFDNIERRESWPADRDHLFALSAIKPDGMPPGDK